MPGSVVRADESESATSKTKTARLVCAMNRIHPRAYRHNGPFRSRWTLRRGGPALAAPVNVTNVSVGFVGG